MAKFIFFTGGVVSGLGKGITAASLGRLLKDRGLSVKMLKLDPYFNMDSSFISPYQHGEIFVTADGVDTDAVVGHYERILNTNMNRDTVVTIGQIYHFVVEKERNGAYKGQTVQIIPHITDEIKRRIRSLATDENDIVITEIGGTVGDIECTPFLEAIRQIQSDEETGGRHNVVYIHSTLLPFIESSQEQKTKPTQRSVKELQDIGIEPDVIICRSEQPVADGSKQRLATHCNVGSGSILHLPINEEIYQIPLSLEKEGLADLVLKKLRLPLSVPNLSAWNVYVEKASKAKKSLQKIKIGIVGKYTTKHDAYESICEALTYSALDTNKGIEFVWIASDDLTLSNVKKRLNGIDGIVVPAGFGSRGFEGKKAACEYARKTNLPLLSFGMGAQAAVCAFLESVCGIKAVSEEFFKNGKTENETIVVRHIYPNDKQKFKRGTFTSYIVDKNSILYRTYKKDEIEERHRHKFEVDPKFKEVMDKAGLTVTAVSESKKAPEVFEIKNHKFFVGVLFRPEFTARPDAPHPLLSAFMKVVAGG